MTKIRALLSSMGIRRCQSVNSDTVSFEAFSNSPVKSVDKIKEKESCLSNETYNNTHPETNPNKEPKFINRIIPTEYYTRPCLFSFLIATFLLVLCLLFLFIYLSIYDIHGEIIDNDQVYFNKFDKNNQSNEQLFSSSHVSRISSVKYSEPLLPPPKPDYNQCKLLKDEDKFDCFPRGAANQTSCEARGCCWIPVNKSEESKLSALNVPYCFYPPNYNTYNYMNITETAFGLEAFLKRDFNSTYPDDINVIKMTVKYETEWRLNVKITDPLHNRFEPPLPEVPIFDKAATNLNYKLDIDSSKPGFRVIRKSDNVVIFDASVPNFIVSNQFLQLSAKLPSTYIYGLGEHQTPLLLPMNWQQVTMFSRDVVPQFGQNLYGSHPFYLMMENSGNSHGVFLLNSNAMDVILQPSPAITFRTIGGILNYYFFLGPTPAEVVKQYTEVIGKPFMVPYWGLGFHLCRYNYGSLNRTKEVMLDNINAGVPLDTQWNDLDYTDNNNMFTYDKKNFQQLPQFVKELHDNGMHYIPLIDAGIGAGQSNGSYPPYDEGILMDIFVKNSSGKPFVGKVWNPIATVWPDFTHPNTVNYWTDMLKLFHNEIAFDGAWIDMNEPSNFWDGQKDGCENSPLNDPPYLPAVLGDKLYSKTLCMTAVQYSGLHYDVHNLFGFMEGIVTSFALAEIRGKRPIVISRSTFPGHGHFAGHWTGDVVSAWVDMKYSIPQMLNFNMFGIPLVGADICGFNGNTTKELCARWSALGAFYPFSRNHNTDNGIDQDPASLGEPVLTAAKSALTIRYSLLPYLYTLMWEAHVYGLMVARPVFFEFAGDRNTYGLDEQFLWGPGLLIIPVLKENVTTVEAYIPAGIWYDYYTKRTIDSKGENITFDAPITNIPLLLRGGYILPQQEPKQTTTASRKEKISLLVSPDSGGNASGNLYWDDGDTLNSYDEKKYSLINFDLTANVLRVKAEYWGEVVPPNLGNVTVLGVNKPVTSVSVNGVAYQSFSYDTINKVLQIVSVNASLKGTSLTWK